MPAAVITCIFLINGIGCNKICTVCDLKSTYGCTCSIISDFSRKFKKVCRFTRIFPIIHIGNKLTICKICLVFCQYNASRIGISMIHCNKMVSFRFNKLVKWVAHIPVFRIHNIRIRICNHQLVFIKLNGYIGLMTKSVWRQIHLMTGSYKKIAVRFCHPYTSCPKRKKCVTIIQSGWTDSVPVLVILCNSVTFHRIWFFLIFLSCYNIVSITAAVETAIYRKFRGKLSDTCNVILWIVIFNIYIAWIIIKLDTHHIPISDIYKIRTNRTCTSGIIMQTRCYLNIWFCVHRSLCRNGCTACKNECSCHRCHGKYACCKFFQLHTLSSFPGCFYKPCWPYYRIVRNKKQYWSSALNA